MNELREFGEINAALARRYGAQTPLVHTMASDAFPILDISFRGMDPELHWLAGSRLCGGAVVRAVDAANQSICRLSNPTSSGVIAVLERVMLGASAATTVLVAMNGGGSTASAAGFFRDGRGWPGTPLRTACLIQSSVGAMSGTLGRIFVDTALVPACYFDTPIVVTPGTSIAFATGAVNEQLECTFYWRERRMVPHEFGD